jgi:hypothetical protein
MHYEGVDLEETMPIIDVSLEVDMGPLKQYLKEQAQEADMGFDGPAGSCSQHQGLEDDAAPRGRATKEAIAAWQERYLRHVLDVLDCMNENHHMVEKL